MITVYLVTTMECPEYRVLGVFSAKALAKAYVESIDQEGLAIELAIEEYRLDSPPSPASVLDPEGHGRHVATGNYLTNQKPRTWDDGVWRATEQGTMILFHNPKCRRSRMTRPNSNALQMLEKGLPPTYVVQHASLY